MVKECDSSFRPVKQTERGTFTSLYWYLFRKTTGGKNDRLALANIYKELLNSSDMFWLDWIELISFYMSIINKNVDECLWSTSSDQPQRSSVGQIQHLNALDIYDILVASSSWHFTKKQQSLAMLPF